MTTRLVSDDRIVHLAMHGVRPPDAEVQDILRDHVELLRHNAELMIQLEKAAANAAKWAERSGTHAAERDEWKARCDRIGDDDLRRVDLLQKIANIVFERPVEEYEFIEANLPDMVQLLRQERDLLQALVDGHAS